MAEHLEKARADILAFTAFPNQRLNHEIRHRTNPVDIFSDRSSIIRLIGAS